MSRRDGILLLGGDGFIGRALGTRLAAQGRTVHVICRSLPATPLAGIRHYVGSLDDSALLAQRALDCDTVVHLASSSTPGSSARNPALELQNLTPTLRLLEQMHGWPQTHLIFLSSGGTVYGNPLHTPVTEAAVLAPLSFYGAGKVAIEHFLQSYRSPVHPVTILRPSNCYGPGQEMRQGFGLIRTVLQHVRQGSNIEVWGDGDSVRDYVYIDDLTEAILRAIDRPADDGTYNIGSGAGHSINAILEIVSALGIGRVATRYRPARSIDVRAIVLDNSRATAALEWRPQVGAAEGVRRTWEWLQKADA